MRYVDIVIALTAGIVLSTAVGRIAAGGPSEVSAQALYSRQAALEADLTRVAQAMPAGRFYFKPTPEASSFGQVITEIATKQHAQCAQMRARPNALLDAGLSGRDGALARLQQSFEFCRPAFASLNELNALDRIGPPADPAKSRVQLLTELMSDTALTLGQLSLYLQLSARP